MSVADPILKYYYLGSKQKGHLHDVLSSEHITAARIETNAMVLGTEEGFVHVVSFAGQLIKSFKAHDRPVNDLSVDNHGLTIASCSDNGTVVIHTIGPDEDKENIVHMSEPLKAVCVEDDSISKRDSSFIVGGASGQLTLHRTVWFAQKNVVLFQGADSAVTTISWRGNLVAWADASQVRVMDISTRSAVCYLDAPSGVGADSPFPCSLFWETESDLFIAWADSFRHLELLPAGGTSFGGGGSGGGGREMTARTVADWQADFIICGVSGFDADHVVLLGYVPPEEGEVQAAYAWANRASPAGAGEASAATEAGGEASPAPELVGNRPEVQICRRGTGELISADTLPMQGNPSQGPWQFRFLSTYQCLTHARDAGRWKLCDITENRGGARGLCPVVFVVSPSEVVVSNVRDVNDRILVALQAGRLREAVNLAYADRTSLVHYKYSELVALYMDLLLDQVAPEGGGAEAAGAAVEAAGSECQRLIGGDAMLWERWIYAFARRKLLHHLAASIPTSSPRLPPAVYEVVLESLLQSDTRVLCAVVDRWGPVQPPLFDHASLLARLEKYRGLDRWLLETQALLYIFAGQFPKALAAYLDCAARHGGREREDSSSSSSSSSSYAHVFELIEQHDLLDCIKHSIPALMLLSKELSAALLVRNVDRLPVAQVVQQLLPERRLLHWYLHSVFVAMPDHYNSPEYAAFHEMQVALYAEFAPQSAGPGEGAEGAAGLRESGFLQFLRASSYAPLDVALKECSRRSPPLYAEMVYILSRTGREAEALGLLLRELQDVQQAVQFVQSHPSAPALWGALIDHALLNPRFLAQLLDHIGACEVNPLAVISRVPPRATLPLLRQRLVTLLAQQGFQVSLNEQCNDILGEDTLHLQRNLNQTQRRAQKVEPSWRCVACARPLFLPPSTSTAASAAGPAGQGQGQGPAAPASAAGATTVQGPLLTAPPQIWGSRGGPGGVVVFSNRIVYHRVCFQKTL